MIREPFGDPPLSRRVTGLITLAVGTDGNRSSIGTITIPCQEPQCNSRHTRRWLRNEALGGPRIGMTRGLGWI
jgi:hypothetical protein